MELLQEQSSSLVACSSSSGSFLAVVVSTQLLATCSTQTDCLSRFSAGVHWRLISRHILVEDLLDAVASLGADWPFGHVACLEPG